MPALLLRAHSQVWCLACKRLVHPPPHTRPKYSDLFSDCEQQYLFHVGVTHCLSHPLALVVACPGANRVHVPPVVLILRVHFRICKKKKKQTFQSTIYGHFLDDFVTVLWQRRRHTWQQFHSLNCMWKCMRGKNCCTSALDWCMGD